MNCDNGRGGVSETTLAELMQDPLIGLLMRSDGVDRNCIETMFEQLACKRQGRSSRR